MGHADVGHVENCTRTKVGNDAGSMLYNATRNHFHASCSEGATEAVEAILSAEKHGEVMAFEAKEKEQTKEKKTRKVAGWSTEN